jgi:hypothetical protein
MERAYVWFVTDHKPNVDIFEMKSLVTSSTARSNLRLQTWGIYLSQFWGRMNVLYSKGSKIDCSDALSHLQYDVSSRSQALCDWAARLGKEPDTAEFEITEAFAITRLSRKAPPLEQETTTAPDSSSVAAKAPDAGIDNCTKEDAPRGTVGRSKESEKDEGIAIVPSADYRCELQQAAQNSSHFSAIYNRLLESEKIIIDGQERHELPETCQYVLHNGILYLNDCGTWSLHLVLASKTLHKQHLLAAHTEAHHGYSRMHQAMRPYYWKKMPQSIRNFIRHWPQWLRNKPANHTPFGLLSPLPYPDEPFDTWSIDLIMDLPPLRNEKHDHHV